MIILCLLFVLVASSCHPECRYLANDPVFPAICETVCDAPVCEFNQTCGYSPSCSVRCPLDMCEVDSCPQCETICAPPPSETCGDILCEATSCSWRCRKPNANERPPLEYEVQCEQPACEYALGSKMTNSVGLILLMLAIIL